MGEWGKRPASSIKHPASLITPPGSEGDGDPDEVAVGGVEQAEV